MALLYKLKVLRYFFRENPFSFNISSANCVISLKKPPVVIHQVWNPLSFLKLCIVLVLMTVFSLMITSSTEVLRVKLRCECYNWILGYVRHSSSVSLRYHVLTRSFHPFRHPRSHKKDLQEFHSSHFRISSALLPCKGKR
jgi:hypothetical protein